ncbi:MAG: 23S rRNA (adenine(2030)-N(6))-methyltransferase RlmJ [Hyphomicrobiales bacterium]|nr:MAG: 23S rRNA (adenine(2030)-N(6))-methyltransferase RlmJ [Hyphomicrobiales bacterium]
MNYRHAFHAGNFADVMKHIILTRLIEYLKLKPGAFRVIDTHAGLGRYSLTGDEAKRNPEWKEGIAKLLKAELGARPAELVKPYLDVIAAENPNSTLSRYPGSPLIARKLFRPQDRLSALELHPKDARELNKLFDGDVQARITALDGWLALNAYVPPKEKRGLVLVDPPFEEKGEWERLVDGLYKAHRKWATGLYALWYPMKEPREINAFVADLKRTGITRMMRVELLIDAPVAGRMFGSGMILVNPPFVLEDELKSILPALVKALAPGKGSHRIEWIRGEA